MQLATKRINELYGRLRAACKDSKFTPIELEILAIKRYLDELATATPTSEKET